MSAIFVQYLNWKNEFIIVVRFCVVAKLSRSKEVNIFGTSHRRSKQSH
jgi:hypothetical protein